MLFMVVETFRPETLALVGERFARQGRLLPPDVVYVDSWMTTDGAQCFQIMHAPDLAALQAWIDRWSDLVRFEVTTVLPSAEYWATGRSADARSA